MEDNGQSLLQNASCRSLTRIVLVLIALLSAFDRVRQRRNFCCHKLFGEHAEAQKKTTEQRQTAMSPVLSSTGLLARHSEFVAAANVSIIVRSREKRVCDTQHRH